MVLRLAVEEIVRNRKEVARLKELNDRLEGVFHKLITDFIRMIFDPVSI